MTVFTDKQETNGMPINDLKNIDNMDNMDLIDALNAHVGFVKEVICIHNHYDIENIEIPWLTSEAASRIDKIKVLIGEIEKRIKRNRHNDRA